MTVSGFAGSCLCGLLLAFVPAALPADETDVPKRRFGTERVFAIALGQPQGLSASAGIIIGSVPARPVKCAFGYSTDGVLIQLEPGIGGGKINLGIASTNGLGGFGVKGTVLRTWGRPWGTRPGTTYLGGEVALTALIRTNVGVLRRVGDGPGGRTLVTWNVGLGF